MRLRLFQPVRGKIGDPMLLEKLVIAYAAWEQADAAFMLSIDPVELDRLHREECPNCPWNGNTIFPESK